MKNRTSISLLVIIFIALEIIPVTVGAEPIIDKAYFYTDNWGPNSLGWEAGHHFVACASVSGYDDPASALTVFAKDENGHTAELLYDWGNWFCSLVENDLKNEGVLEITANATDGSATKNTCDLNNIKIMKLAQNIRCRYDAAYYLPVISWDPVGFAHRYFVRFYVKENDGYRELLDCRSPSLRNPFYVIPDDLPNCNINQNDAYILRILSSNYDLCDQNESGYATENRSSTWVDFIPPRKTDTDAQKDPNAEDLEK